MTRVRIERWRLFHRQARAVRLFHEQRLLGTLSAFPPDAVVTIVGLAGFLAALDRAAARPQDPAA